MADLGAWYASIPRSTPVEGAPPEAAASCAACHGPQGDQPAMAEAAILAGQSAAYLEQVLKEYRAGTRINPVMQAAAKDLVDSQVAELAAWFASRAALVTK
jgi:cytochrome c553